MARVGAAGPNDALKMARLRMLSPSGSRRALSRQELADAANRYLHDRYGLRSGMDDSYIGKLE